MISVATRFLPPTSFRTRLNRGQETIAITAATDIAVAKGQTTKKQPMAMNEPKRNRTT